ncbi:glycosyltransferase [Streptomyces sp. MN03-5084-2B]|nr:glycosyltransferase [Streptomyces sp. MN03-5084-2B]
MPCHFAFVNIPAHGHVTPTLAVVAELVRRGHRVTYATTAEFAPAVAATGADVLTVGSTLTSTHPGKEVTADDVAWLPLILLRESVLLAPALLERFEADRPDVLAYDVTLYPLARMLGRRWNRPTLELFPTFAANQEYSVAKEAERIAGVAGQHPATAAFHAEFTEFLARNGFADVTPEDLTRGEPDEPRLVFLTREFQYAGETFDERFAFVGPCLSERGFQGGWTPPSTGLPIVYVSLGTAHNLRPEFFRACVTAFAGRPVHVVLSVGDRVPASSLGELPPNVEVHARVPQLTVLRHASAFVCHAGMGSTMESLHFGTPLVAVPQMPEQDAVAARLAELGLGRVLGRGEVTPESLREAVEGVLADDALHARLRDESRRVREAGGTRAAADRLEAYAEAAVRV